MTQQLGLGMAAAAFFLFLYFSKSVFIEIYFRFHNLQIYGPAAPQSGGRDLNVNKIYF